MGSGHFVGGAPLVSSRRVTEISADPFAGLVVVHDQGVVGLDDVELFHAADFSSLGGDDSIVILAKE